MVISILSGIKHALQNQTSDNVELGEMADELSENIRDALDVRFAEVHSENLHKKATFLDPRYRGCFFEADALKSIESELSREIISERNRQKDNDESGPVLSQERTWNFFSNRSSSQLYNTYKCSANYYYSECQ